MFDDERLQRATVTSDEVEEHLGVQVPATELNKSQAGKRHLRRNSRKDGHSMRLQVQFLELYHGLKDTADFAFLHNRVANSTVREIAEREVELGNVCCCRKPASKS